MNFKNRPDLQSIIKKHGQNLHKAGTATSSILLKTEKPTESAALYREKPKVTGTPEKGNMGQRQNTPPSGVQTLAQKYGGQQPPVAHQQTQQKTKTPQPTNQAQTAAQKFGSPKPTHTPKSPTTPERKR